MAALDLKRLTGDFLYAASAQAVGLLVGFANTLLLPKLLSVPVYGYWQLFLFYAGYTGVFAFGLVDGVYLVLGGERREGLDRRAVNAQFWCCAVMQLAVSAILLAAGFAEGGPERSVVIFGVALYLVFFNTANFLGYLFQAIGETRRYSLSVIVESLVFFAGMLGLILVGVVDLAPYVIAYVVSRACRLGYCAWYARDILRSGFLELKEAVRLSLASMRVGVKLLVSNLAALFIVGVARLVIDLSWDIEAFAVVSLALALVNVFMTFTSQVAMVLFPALRRVEAGELSALFLRLRDWLSLILPVLYVLYGPVVLVLGAWLPAYAEAFSLFALLLPLCVYNGKMDVVGFTMLKVLRREDALWRINVITCLVSSAGALAGAFWLHSIPAILIWIVAAVIARCLFAERYVTRALGLPGGFINLGSVVVSVVAIVANVWLGLGWSTLVVALAYIMYLGVFRNETAKLVARARRLGPRS